jgi:hypothetical protein
MDAFPGIALVVAVENEGEDIFRNMMKELYSDKAENLQQSGRVFAAEEVKVSHL